ncbi:MAG: N-acetylmuramoyl-L-alanine amidase, partial [Coriobacteriia bacterium]|nr:N-acetylmuramoyl-L-alanine amidase [Coriobacteriia bacterium]
MFIDPGHGGRYSNANLPSLGIYEKNVNLAIALALRDQLAARGHTVIMARTTDVAVGTVDIPTWKYSSADDRWGYYADGTTSYSDGVPRDDLQARCNLANASGADIFISVHNNGATSSSANGFENYASSQDILGTRLSRIVQDEVIDATPLGDRGAANMDFYVVKWSHMPAILVEGAFLTNTSDRSYVTSWSGRTTLARAIADGVDEFLATDPYQPVWPRIAGDNRFGTAAALAQTGWPNGSKTVILATGKNWPDALASAPLSHKLDAPLLLATPNELPTETAEELVRLSPESIVVLGGEEALSSEVASAAAAAAGLDLSAVERIAGTSRYDTAALIARRVGVSSDGKVVVVTGDNPADAVSVAPYAGSNSLPILLVQPGSVPTSVASFLAD